MSSTIRSILLDHQRATKEAIEGLERMLREQRKGLAEIQQALEANDE